METIALSTGHAQMESVLVIALTVVMSVSTRVSN